jgi:hypothetical protein
MDVFRTLMRTRRMRLNPDHVGALNLVEIEFYRQADVIAAWETYWEHLRRAFASSIRLSSSNSSVIKKVC